MLLCNRNYFLILKYIYNTKYIFLIIICDKNYHTGEHLSEISFGKRHIHEPITDHHH